MVAAYGPSASFVAQAQAGDWWAVQRAELLPFEVVQRRVLCVCDCSLTGTTLGDPRSSRGDFLNSSVFYSVCFSHCWWLELNEEIDTIGL